jgi:hypothetical protein
MQLRYLAMAALLGVVTMTSGSEASPLSSGRFACWSSLLPSGTPPERSGESTNPPPRAWSERQIVLSEALDDSERSRHIRTRLSADGRHFQVFLVGKDGDLPLKVHPAAIRVSADVTPLGAV